MAGEQAAKLVRTAAGNREARIESLLLADWYALQVGRRLHEPLKRSLHFRYRPAKVGQAVLLGLDGWRCFDQVTQHQPPWPDCGGNFPHDGGSRVTQRECVRGGMRHGQVQHQNIGAGRELDEPGIPAALIASQYHTPIAEANPIRQRGHVAVRYAKRRHLQVTLKQYPGRGRRVHVHCDDLEAHATPSLTQRPTQDGERAGGIEEPPDERIHGRKETGTRGTSDFEGLLAEAIALPEQRGQVGDVVGVEVTDREEREIGQASAGFGEAEVDASSGVDHDDGPAIAPDQVPGGGAIS